MDGNDCCVAAVTACLGHSACPFAGQRGARHAQAYGQRGAGVGGSPQTTRSTRIPHRASAASGGGRALSRPAGLCPRGQARGRRSPQEQPAQLGTPARAHGARAAPHALSGLGTVSPWPATWRPWPAQAGRRELVTLGQPQAEPVTLEEGFSAAPPGGGGGVPGCPWSPGPSGRVPAAVASLLLSRHRRRCRAGPRPWKARLGGDGHPTGTRVRCRPCHAQSTAGSAATPSPSRGAPGPREGGAVPARWRPEGTGLEPGREAACMTQASGLRGAAETPAGVRGRALQDVTSRLRLPPQGAGGWPQGPQRCGHCRCP